MAVVGATDSGQCGGLEASSGAGTKGRRIVEKAIVGHRSAAERAMGAAEAFKEVPNCDAQMHVRN